MSRSMGRSGHTSLGRQPAPVGPPLGDDAGVLNAAFLGAVMTLENVPAVAQTVAQGEYGLGRLHV
jgi:hypothetical protein